MKKKLFQYPKEYLGEAYIHPRTFRKNELAILLDLPWQQIRTEINNDEELLGKLTDFRYKPSRKSLYTTQVAILFFYFGPPLATPGNLKVVESVDAVSKLSVPA